MRARQQHWGKQERTLALEKKRLISYLFKMAEKEKGYIFKLMLLGCSSYSTHDYTNLKWNGITVLALCFMYYNTGSQFLRANILHYNYHYYDHEWLNFSQHANLVLHPSYKLARGNENSPAVFSFGSFISTKQIWPASVFLKVIWHLLVRSLLSFRFKWITGMESWCMCLPVCRLLHK